MGDTFTSTEVSFEILAMTVCDRLMPPTRVSEMNVVGKDSYVDVENGKSGEYVTVPLKQ